MEERVIGVDLGKAQDFTAVVVVKRRERLSPDETDEQHAERLARRRRAEQEARDYGLPLSKAPEIEPVYWVTDIHRPELGTSYPTIVSAVAKLVARSDEPTRLVVDATGVGMPVVDMMRDAGLKPVPAWITSGHEVTNAHGRLGVPKADIVSCTQALLQSGRLVIASGLDLAGTLIEEMHNYQERRTALGNVTYDTWREGAHDDLVFALCLAVWLSDRKAWQPFVHIRHQYARITDGN